ncbi:hypothetical protein ACFE04_004311 [Oxalis oulophora]
MALAALILPPFLSLPNISSRKRKPLRFLCRSVSLSLQLQQQINNDLKTKSAAILWFKQDLRIDDHPGLAAVSSQDYSTLVPLYVFDHRILLRYSDEMLELLLLTLHDLRMSLKQQGSNLFIGFGRSEDVIRQLLKEVNATTVYAEEEVEYHLLEIMNILEENTPIVKWRTPFYDIQNLNDLPLSHNDFENLQLPVTSPSLFPTSLPTTDSALDWGHLPSFDALKDFVNESTLQSEKSWTSLKEISAETMLWKKSQNLTESNQNRTDRKQILVKRPKKSVFLLRKDNVVGGGTDVVLNALAGYLRYLEGTGRDDWQEVHEKLRNSESRSGASFFALFGPALSLGIISRRRVHFEAIKYEKERNAGFLSPFGYSTVTVSAAVDVVRSMEWYWLMARKSQMSVEERFSCRTWRWKGFLIQYTVVGQKGPAVLLVHGFGAFFQHYRDNVNDIAERGHRVWAITVLGFGKSEKPNIVYTELMWAELLRDFIIEVVGEPVHLAGNSIGGYFAAILAGSWPSLVKSVVLINSAGNVIPGYSNILLTKERQTSAATWLGARLLSFFLRSSVKSTMKSYYPVEPKRADDWLINEIQRASYDPGVLVVLESIFSIDLSIPLNCLLEGLPDKGMKDPLLNSKSKLAMIKEHCAGVVIKELDAGHCPQDELPETVNSIICEWIARVESRPLAIL